MGASKPGSGSFGGDPSVDNCSTTNPNAYDGQNFVYNPNDDTCMGFGDGVWKEVTGSMILANDPGATVTDVGIDIALTVPGPWQGSVYIDDFEIVP
jgi:hypothetical protein